MTIKIELRVEKCRLCPYIRNNNNGTWCGHHKKPKDGIEFDSVPKDCPFPKADDYVDWGIDI